MTVGLLDLAELAARSGMPAPDVRRYAEMGLLRPAHRDGDRFGYPAAETDTVRLLGGAERLGLADALPALADAWHGGDCRTARQQLADAVAARLGIVQAAITDRQQQMAGAHRTGQWAEVTSDSLPLFEDAARLQAVSRALNAADHSGGPCGDGCGCLTALNTPITTYRFPTATAAPGAATLACDLAADGGDASDRIDVWQQVLTRVEGRDPLPAPERPDEAGIVLRFPFDVDLAATLGRLAAAEYRCCSFGSYTLVIDHTGLRLEIRMPADAAETLTAVVGVATAPESAR